MDAVMSLNFNHNKISLLPSFLLHLPKLKWISVHHNPVKGVTKELLNKGTNDWNYLEKFLGNQTEQEGGQGDITLISFLSISLFYFPFLISLLSFRINGHTDENDEE